MNDFELVTPDDVSRATTPNALKSASLQRLDHIYNVARGHLRGTDEGLLRQTESSIDAVVDEKAWRRGKPWRWVTGVSVVAAVISVVIAGWTLRARLSDSSEIRRLRAEIADLSDRVRTLESPKTATPPPTPTTPASPP